MRSCVHGLMFVHNTVIGKFATCASTMRGVLVNIVQERTLSENSATFGLVSQTPH